jgi:hypothetical protein
MEGEMASGENEMESRGGLPRSVVGAAGLSIGIVVGYVSMNARAVNETPPAPPAAPAPAASASVRREEPPAPPPMIERAGYVDKNGRLAIAAEYKEAAAFHDGLGRVSVDGKWGFVDTEGKVAIAPTFVDADDFSDGLALVRNEEKKAGFIDRSGNLVIDYAYDVAWPFRNGVAIVGIGEEGERKHRIIRKSGETIARPPWEPIGNFSEGVAPIRVSDAQIGFFDPTGKVIVRVRLDAVRDFHDGMAVCELHGKTCAMNREWHVSISPMFDKMTDFAEGLAGASDDSHYGFVDKKGKFVIPATYDDAGAFSEGLAAVARDGRYGFVDRTGHEVIEPRFDQVRPFSHGLAAARVAGKFGYVDKEARWVVEPQFIRAGDFGAEGLAPVSVMRPEKERTDTAPAKPASSKSD